MRVDRALGWAAVCSAAAGLAAAAGPGPLGRALLVGPAAAATDTDQLTVTATVESGCALNGGTLNFGQYISGQAQPLDAVGQINYSNCVGDLTFELDLGQNGNASTRQMGLGTARLRYQLYRDTARTAVWGTGTTAQAVRLFIPQNGRLDVFGRIPGGQGVADGTYTDVVNITLTF